MTIKPTVPIQAEKNSEKLRLTEIYAIAVLRANGVRFQGVEPTPGGRVAFLFDDEGGKASALVQAHRDRGVDVNSADFAAAVTWAKDIIFGSRG